MDTFNVPAPSEEFQEIVKSGENDFVTIALANCRKTFGTLSDREVEMVTRVVSVTFFTLIQTHNIVGKFYSDFPAVVDHWKKVEAAQQQFYDDKEKENHDKPRF